MIKVVFIQDAFYKPQKLEFYVKTKNYAIAEKVAVKQLKKERPNFFVYRIIMSERELLEVDP